MNKFIVVSLLISGYFTAQAGLSPEALSNIPKMENPASSAKVKLALCSKLPVLFDKIIAKYNDWTATKNSNNDIIKNAVGTTTTKDKKGKDVVKIDDLAAYKNVVDAWVAANPNNKAVKKPLVLPDMAKTGINAIASMGCINAAGSIVPSDASKKTDVFAMCGGGMWQKMELSSNFALKLVAQLLKGVGATTNLMVINACVDYFYNYKDNSGNGILPDDDYINFVEWVGNQEEVE